MVGVWLEEPSPRDRERMVTIFGRWQLERREEISLKTEILYERGGVRD